MSRLVVAMVMAGLLIGASGAIAADRPDAEVRHSGKIVEVAPGKGRLVLEEMVAWSGTGTGVIRRTFQLTPRTSIQLVTRTDEFDTGPGARPGFRESALPASDLRAGDFVTVTAAGDRRTVAVALEVVRPGDSR